MEYTEFITEAHKHQEGKVCTKCNKHQPLSEFYARSDYSGGLQFQCKSCYKKYNDNLCRFKKWFITKKSHANGIEFTIEPTDIPGVKIRETIKESRNRKYVSWEAAEYPKVCPVLEIELDWNMNGQQPNSPSLDRIDPTKGYIPGNVMIMSTLANRMKNNATPEQLKQFCRYHLFNDKKK